MPSKSKKQARLMAAVAHNPRFAKKVGIPQSVGREFNDAGRVLRKYAEGGKVGQALRFLKLGLENREYPVLSNPATPEDAGRMRMLMKEIFPKSKTLRTWESANNSVAFPAQVGIHEQVIKQLQDAYPDEEFEMGLMLTLDELEDQLKRKGRFTGYESKYDPDAEDVDDTHPGFADGGEVLPSSKEEDEEWSDTYIKRPLSGLASMWGATDPETGDYINPAWYNIKRIWNADERRRKGLPRQKMATLGIVDETLSLPALGEIVGLPAPQFAKDAEERASTTREAARDAIGVDEPHGFVENLTESAGVMAGQMPVPAAWANKLKLLKESGKLGKAGKIFGPAAEWFSPTVVPKASNYIKGTLFGGLLGGGLDYAEDYMDEKRQKELNEQFISEAMAEVLEEERVKRGQESGDDTTDEEALAELGYAEGGRVGQARKVIGSLRSILSEADPEDVATRKAAIDQALHAIKGTEGPTDIDRQHLHTMTAGLADAAADTVPARRRQRFGDYESNILKLLEGQAPQLVERRATPRGPVPAPADYPPPAPLPAPRPDDPHVRLDRDLGPMDPATSYNPARGMDNRHGALTQEEWERMLNIKKQFATGGKVQNNPWESPQAQKEAQALAAQQQAQQGGTSMTQKAGQPRTGAPLSQEWYENYGAGPEHLFMGDRTVKLHDMWGPKHYGATPPPVQQQEGSWLPGVGIVGLALYDEWKKKRGQTEGADTSQQAFWNDMHASAANTADTDAWVAQQLDQYGTNAPMPVMGEDGSVSYVEPNKFWQDMHRSAIDTSDTDAWVNSQLENYNAPMPVINDDGMVSYVNAQGDPVESGGLNLGRAWQGVGGAYDMYSGLQAGDAQGYVRALQGANDLYGSYTGTQGLGGAAGAGVGALSGLSSIYGGIQEGGVKGYTQAAGGVAQTAQSLGYNNGAVGALGTAASVVGALYSAYGAYESAKVGDKKGAVAQGAAAGAAIGSVVPVIGTAVGAVVGAVVGLIGASLGNKENPSEIYYGQHKKLKPEEVVRGWSADQVNGAVFETIKSHTKSGNVNRFKDVGEMYTAFGITKDAHKNYKNVQTQMGDFIKGVVQTAQQMGSLPTDPMELKQLDGQQIYYKVVVPALAAKYKEATGKDSTAWTTDKIKPGQGSMMHELMADWTDWMTSHWGDQANQQQAQKAAGSVAGAIRGGRRAQEHARGGRVQSFHDDPRSGALSALQ
jgi:hypothetical protein